jgi:hypothetical protein
MTDNCVEFRWVIHAKCTVLLLPSLFVLFMNSYVMTAGIEYMNRKKSERCNNLKKYVFQNSLH